MASETSSLLSPSTTISFQTSIPTSSSGPNGSPSRLPGPSSYVSSSQTTSQNRAPTTPIRGTPNYSAVPLYRQLSKAPNQLPHDLFNDNFSSFLDDSSSILPSVEPKSRPARTLLNQIPPILLATLLNLMLSVPFGSAFFPMSSPTACPPPPPLIGVRLFLLSTILGQTILGTNIGGSGFDESQGMMMVENTPFMHSIAQSVTEAIIANGGGSTEECPDEVFPTILVAFSLTTLITSLSFFLLGHFNLGNIVYFFPKHVLCGCISGIGVFVVTTGLEVSKGIGKLEWTSLESIEEFFGSQGENGTGIYLFLLPCTLVFLLRLIIRLLKKLDRSFPLLPPLFFLSITPCFYIFLWLFNIKVSRVKQLGFLFPPTDGDTTTQDTSSTFEDGGVDPSSFAAIFFPSYSFAQNLSDPFALVSWSAIAKTLPVQLGCVVFSLMHVPINIPSMSMSVNKDCDMNSEMIAHGRSNLLSALFAQLPNYMCYSNSVAYAKSGGRGQPSSLAVITLTTLLFLKGSSLVESIPRAMAGTLLIHVGLDLFFEGISAHGFSALEIGSIWAIVVSMTLFGMTAGLAAGMVLAAITFVVDAGPAHLSPIRGHMPATTLRSSKWRSVEARDILNKSDGLRRIVCVQLQGHLYFANLTQFTDAVKEIIEERKGFTRFLVLDFTLVIGIDSSAAFSLLKLVDTMAKRNLLKIAFVTGKADGFPCTVNLSEQLRSRSIAVTVKDLDKALELLEDMIVSAVNPNLINESFFRVAGEETEFLHAMMLAHCPTADKSTVKTLLTYFKRVGLKKGEVVWKQGGKADRLCAIVRGQLLSYLEEEAGTTERVVAGDVVGELGLIMGHEGERRLTTLVAEVDCVVYELTSEAFATLKAKKPAVAIYLFQLCVRYMSHRLQHVSNRFVETKCIPI
ncbi:hypothetical protein TL16_g03534 [Triparma laevis f. inornata]|uniref:Sulfate transporter n=1 Tax=Triparma laevis f. inornata TaxID=1714386 RepID=A0A9W7E2B6_9STRA|nr:hypothetical protein TL16_g03534 [Triparma laevis f. inornata]